MSRRTDGQHEHSATTTAGRSLPTTGPDTVVVHGEGVRVDRVQTGLPHAEARSRFGGVDLMSVLAGTSAALGSTAVLGSVAGALGRVGYEQGAGDEQLSALGLTAGLVVLGLSLLLGGWVAGRVARYEGGRNGLLTGLAFVLLSAALAAAAARSDAVRDLGLPGFLSDDALTLTAVGSAVTGLIVALGAAVLGGRLGARYHRRVDDALLSVRPGGLAPYPDGATTSTTTTTTRPTGTGR